MKPLLKRYGRSKVLAFGLLAVMAIFVLQLFYLQIIRHGYYEDLAEKEHLAKFDVPAKRGKIYAREGENTIIPLVLNQPVYTAFGDPQEIKDKQKVIAAVQRIAGGNVVEGFEKSLDDKKLRYVVLARQLTRQQAELLKKEGLFGVGLQEADQRVYPEGSLAGQLLGYVNADGKGQYGIEGALDERLRGEPGVLQTITDVRRIPLTIGGNDIRKAAKDGDDLVLTIDRNIQAYAEQALKRGLDNAGATTGNIVVMDPNTGGVLAMANYPNYDPSKYNEITDYSVLQNRAVSEPFEPGSVIKVLSMGVGLDTGAVKKNSTFNNTGSIQVDDTEISNIEEDPINPAATMTDVLHYSLNTGVVHVLQQMGGGQVNRQARDKLYEYYKNHFFFGKNTGIEQAGEQPGILISPDEEQGNNVRYANMVFGQGVDMTMIQVASAFSATMNGGTYYKPTLIYGVKEGDKIEKQKPQVVRKDVMTPANSATLRDMTYQARQLGLFKGKDKPGYIVGGKTGTSEIIDPTTGKYSEDNSIGTYLGFGGNEKPRYVIMIQVKDSKLPGYAGTVAAGPIFTDMSNWMIDYLKIPPVR
ncbi:penicillin-binding protein 2 [Candidatus Saccharibacteria bacterium]|nr:penicillin-binding protein 2 [Candidatus Saccharibacteria bacterium]